MPRSLYCNALCLRVRPSGESNREAWFLSAGNPPVQGIFRATVFGGPKSRIRSQVSPFHQGNLWVYHDPVRDSLKVTDFDVKSWRPGLRGLYERTMAAQCLAETILETHGGGGGWGTAVELAAKTLDCLGTGDEKNIGRILLHFFWAWAEFLGSRPDLNICLSCACEIPLDKVLWYDQQEGSIYCNDCRGESDTVLDPGARRWLSAVGVLEPGEALRYSLGNSSFMQTRAFVLGILTTAIGKRLPLWDHYID